jgi:long-chain acyl-CoA synthetase
MTAAEFLFDWEKLYTGKPMDEDPSCPNLLALFQRALGRAADQAAIYYFDQQISYRELDELSTRLANHLQARGFEPGDRLAMYMQNMPAFFIGSLAAWKAGGIAVPFNPMVRSSELGKLLPDCTPKAILVLDELAPYVRQAIAELDITPDIILTRASDFQTRDDARIMPPGDAVSLLAGESELTEVLDAAATEPLVDMPLDDHSPAYIVYTSGTTGIPKGVIITHDNACWNGLVMERWMHLEPGLGPMLGIAPLFHITGLVTGPVMAWQLAEAVVINYRFHPAVVFEEILARRPSFCAATITAYNALVSSPEFKPEHFDCFHVLVCGGSPLPPALAEAFYRKTGVHLHNGYGLTETTAPATTVPYGVRSPVDHDSGATSVGIPCYKTNVWIAGENGEALAQGEVGEIVIQGRAVSPGYWNKPEVSAEFMRADGFRTGDVGFFDADGYLYIVDRKKDMISASGYKVWPREVEDTIYNYPGVHEVAVVGVPDEYRGETVKAVLSLKPGAEFNESDFISWCRDCMSAYKVPKFVQVLDELPKNPAGKILRRALKDQ